MKDEEEEDNGEEDVELQVNVDTPPSQLNDAGNASARDVHSHLVTSGNYSSLVNTQIAQYQPATYSHLGLSSLATVLPVVPYMDEENNMEERARLHTYYNIQ